jgi:MoxR-like ATPase
MSDHAPAAEIASTRDAIVRLKANMRLTIKGKDEVIEQTWSASSPAGIC